MFLVLQPNICKYFLEREYGVPVTMGRPKVAFRETLHTDKVEYDFWHR